MFNRITILLLTFLLASFAPISSWAASTKAEVLALKEEVQALKEGQDQMKSDLAEIKKLLESGAKPAPAAPAAPVFEERDLAIDSTSTRGSDSAPITLFEYSDYQCPFCSRHATQTMPELIKNYIDQGKLKFVMREFPIVSLHSRAPAAAEAALCARDQGKYWEMHDILFENRREMSDENLISYAQTIGLNTADFTTCLESDKHEAQIEKDLAEGQSMGVRGTPSFVLGFTDEEDSNMVRVTRFVRGARSYDSFAKEIDEMLKEVEETGP